MNDPNREFDQLLSRHFDGEVSAEESARLSQLLAGDAELVRQFSRAAALHNQVRSLLKCDRAVAPPLVFDEEALPSPARWPWFAGGALFALCSGLLALLIWRPNFDVQAARNPSPAVPAVRAEPAVAYLTVDNGAIWGGDRLAIRNVGSAVQLGDEIALNEGIAEFRLSSGVYLSLEGPASVVLASPSTLVLQYGKLTAHVPWLVKDFHITAGMLRLVASDAELGVNLSGDSVDAHVFSGEVLATNAVLDNPEAEDAEDAEGDGEVASKDARGAFSKAVIAEGRSLVMAMQGNGVKAVRWGKATPELFATKLTMSGGLPISKSYVDAVISDGPLGYWRFESSKHGTVPSEVSGGSDLTIMGDLRLSGLTGNRVAEFRPGSESYLVSERRLDELANSDYSVELWMKPSHLHSGDVLALCAGEKDWNALLIELQGSRSMLPRASFSRTNPCSIRFLHRDPPAASFRAGTSCLSTVPYNIRRWQHVVAVKRSDQLELYLDGKIVAHGVDGSSLQTGLRLVVGRQDPNENILPFSGQLDELAIYSKALSKEAILKHIKLIDWSRMSASAVDPDA